jgi:hypothetical protein
MLARLPLLIVGSLAAVVAVGLGVVLVLGGLPL